MSATNIDPSKLLGFKLMVAEAQANAAIGIKSGGKIGSKEGKSGFKAGVKAGKVDKIGAMQGKVSLRPV